MGSEIKNLNKAAQRILAAVESGEKIILYGDADVDGSAAVAITEEAIEKLNPEYADKNLSVYFLNREKEGYGINEKALEYLNSKLKGERALLVAVDCGIGNTKEVEMAKEMNIETIIIDHHKVLPEIPDAFTVVDPKQKEDQYPFNDFSAAGLTYKLAEVLLEEKLHSSSLLELVALSTIADRMPLKKDNKEFVQKGLEALNKTQRAGIRALMAMVDLEKPVTVQKIRTKVLPVLNSSKTKNHVTQAYFLFTEDSTKEAEKIVEQLQSNSKESSRKMEQMFEEIESRITSKNEEIIFEGDSSWPLTLNGAVASRICEKFKKPTFLFRIGAEWTRGGVRVPKGFDAVEAMESCKKLLKTYGGHAPAAGFTIATDNVQEFKECLVNYFKD